MSRQVFCFVPGGSTCSVFRNSITASRSYSDNPSNASRDDRASPSCASTACQTVVYSSDRRRARREETLAAAPRRRMT